MTEPSSAYFKPTIQKQTVSMLEKQAGFLQMIGRLFSLEVFKNLFINFHNMFWFNLYIIVKYTAYKTF